MLTEGIFDGVRIVELAQYVFVPGAGAIFADFGAEVIHVEEVSGDPYRKIPLNDGRIVKSLGANLAIEQNNRGKKSLAVDLKTEQGREIILKLLDTADILLTSIRPAAMARLQLSPEILRERNPRLIYVRGNGFGFRGDEQDRPGLDGSAFWARGGFASIYTPADAHTTARSRPALGDHVGAMNIAFGMAAALFRRERTGKGSLVESSLLGAAMWTLSSDVVSALNNPAYVEGTLFEQSYKYPLLRGYRTRDGRWLQIMILAGDRHWPSFCATIGLPELAEDPRFKLNEQRVANGQECVALVSAAIAGKDWEEWRPLFENFDAPWELVRTVKEVSQDPQAIANGYIVEADLGEGRMVKMVSGPVAIDETTVVNPTRAPHIGEHSDELLRELGIADTEIATLREAGIVG